MKERDSEFELWWRGEDEEFRDELRKRDAKRELVRQYLHPAQFDDSNPF
jgi:hypothetical protein